jgi:hypothetical protein
MEWWVGSVVSVVAGASDMGVSKILVVNPQTGFERADNDQQTCPRLVGGNSIGGLFRQYV